MADDLKRVGLVFKEEGAVDFRKTLQDINVEMNKNYNQFKLTQSQWDSSTKSTEKLKVQQEYLTNAIEIQGDKVNTLRMQLEEMENSENKNTTAIKKKQNELTNAEIKLKNYENQLKDVNSKLDNFGIKVTEAGEKLENVGGKIENAGKKVSAFSAATSAAFVASAKSAIDFEDAFAGVEKTVDGTDEEMAELRQGIRDMAKEIPTTTTEISAVAEAAGQLGIKTEDILSFTRVMIDLGNSTNLSAEEAASSLAKFANVTQMSAKDYDKLGSTIVALGNNFATTEADIVAMASNLASTGKQVGMTESDIMALATALSSVGLEAQAGGTAFSKALTKMQLAVETNSEELKDWADVAGMSVNEFADLFKKDATKALEVFIKGLSKCGGETESAIKVLNDMGITETRMRDALLRSANASDVFSKAIELGSKAWQDNTALTNEANKRYDTLKSKIEIATNKLKDCAITIGEKLMPFVQKAVDKIEDLAKWFSSLNDKQVETVLNIGAIVAATGPLLTIIGKVTSAIGGTMQTIGTVSQAIGVMRGTITSTSTAVNSLAGVFSALTSPVGLACLGIVAAIGGISVAVAVAEKDTKEAFSNMGSSASDFITGIDGAKSHLNDFNSTLFVSAKEQQGLQTQMSEVQQGITNICKTASDERRGYTQEEIVQLDEYFTKLRELNQREIEIQQAISDAITQQAVTNAETFQGSLEEYKVQSQEWLKTAEEQKDKTIELINKQSIEEVALLNQRYGDQANMQNDAYATEYNNIMTQKQNKIDAANSEINEISQAYANGYLERSKQEDGWYQKIQKYNQKIQEENSKHNTTLENIENNSLLTQSNKRAAKEQEEYRHENAMKKTWKQLYKDMDESQEEQLGVWLAELANTELYGGKIDNETQKILNSILDSYESMPKKTKEAMKNAMEPMLTEMQNKEPELYSKASGIANGILSRLRKAFDINSPSRKTREIFKNVMKRNGERN